LETSGEKSESPETSANVSIVALAVGEVEGVDDHADVRRVLAAVAALGDVDQLDGVFVKGALVLHERFQSRTRDGP